MQVDKLEIRDRNNILRVLISLDTDDRPFIELYDDLGLGRIQLSLNKTNEGYINFFEASGNPLIGLGISELFGPSACFRESGTRSEVIVSALNNGSIVLFSSDGNERVL